VARCRGTLGKDILSIGVLAFPRASNLTDLDPLVDEPGVVLRPISRPEEMETCDLVILPGTRATVNDLYWLRERGFASALARRAAEGRSVLGLCGGYQMLGGIIDDDVEGAVGRVDGLGLLPVRTVFQHEKVLARRRVVLDDGSILEGYEIHTGACMSKAAMRFSLTRVASSCRRRHALARVVRKRRVAPSVSEKRCRQVG